jgi:hypothetical protein
MNRQRERRKEGYEERETNLNKRIQKQNTRVILSLHLNIGPYAIDRKAPHIPEFYARGSGRLLRSTGKYSPTIQSVGSKANVEAIAKKTLLALPAIEPSSQVLSHSADYAMLAVERET